MAESFIKDFLWLILLICGWILNSMFSPYFKKKGENQATKEDIKELTLLVKDVETKLDISKNISLSLHNEAKTATINLHNTIFEIFNLISDPTLDYIDYSNNSELQSYLNKANRMFDKLMSEKSFVSLFIEDIEVQNQFEKVIHLLVSDQRMALSTYISQIMFLNITKQSISETEFDKRRGKADRIFHEEMIKNNSIINPEIKHLTKVCRKYLKQNPTN